MHDYAKRSVQKTDQHRLYNLDYLRGLAAFAIMIYHYSTWSFWKFPADTFMGRVGVYGVCIFYVLSGLTLYYVYYDKMNMSRRDIIAFFKKRVFRIFPLLWLVTFTAILLSRRIPDFSDLFLNLTGLFGFVKWDTYFSAGMWSIGNELVFYVFFPFFVLFAKSTRPMLFILSAALFSLYLYFAFVKLDPALSMDVQWKDYINPLNQVFLFLGGFLIGLLLHNIKINNSIVVMLLLSGLAVFTFYPTTENAISIVTGANRLIFTACCFLICICFYKLTFLFPKFIHKPLSLLGETSYSIYLLHPIVWTIVGFASKVLGKHILIIPTSVRLPLSVLLTLILSYYVYQYFEKYFMKLGKSKR